MTACRHSEISHISFWLTATKPEADEEQDKQANKTMETYEKWRLIRLLPVYMFKCLYMHVCVYIYIYEI